MSFEKIKSVLTQDMLALTDALEEDKLSLFNIFANRIISNLYFGETTDFIILGFIMKDVQAMLTLIQRSRSKSLYAEARDIILDILGNINDSLSEQILTLELIWEKYEEIENTMRKYLLYDAEYNSYELMPEFTRYTVNKMINLLVGNQDFIFNPNSKVFEGCTNEIARLINTHGFYKNDLLIFIILKTSLRVFEYRRYGQSISLIEKKENDAWISIIIETVQLINKEPSLDFKIHFEKGNKIIQNLGGEWRIYYIKFRDLFREVEIKSSAPILTQDERKSLTNNIASMIEKEV